MAVFEIETPDGRKFRIEGETKEGALAALQQHLGVGSKPPAQEEIGDVSGMAAFATQGALASFGDEYMAGLSAALGVQPDGKGGANWFQYDKPLRERYGTALEAIRGEMDDYREENPWKAGGAQVAGAVGTALLAGPRLAAAGKALGIKSAVSTGSRLRRLAVAGAGAGAIEGFGAGEGGFEERAKSAAIGAGVGAVFAPLVGLGVSKVANVAGNLYGKAARAVFVNRRMYNPNSGQLTDAGRKRLADLGFDDLDAMSQEMQRSLGVAAEKVGNAADEVRTPETVARVAQADRFGVPLTVGQSTGDVAQIATEENMRAGTRGQGAMDAITGFDRTQRATVDAARENVILSPSFSSPDRVDAADAVISGVRREAEAARLAGRQAYDELAESGAALGANSFASLRRNIEMGAQAANVAIDEGTPNARAALQAIERKFSDAKGSIPFNDVERLRQQIVQYRRAAQSGANGADQTAISAVVDSFDDYLDTTITDALVSGSDKVLDQAKNARGLWAKYRSTFLGRDGADNFIRKIVEDDLAPDQVAGWLFGASSNIGGGQTSLIARRVKTILGETSPEWQSVRRAAWDRITQNTAGKDAWGPQQIASNISELLDGKGKTLGAEMFSKQERAVMVEFRDMLKVLVPPRKATNPSGTSYDLQRVTADMVRSLGIVMSAGTGGADAAIGAAIANQGAAQASGFRATLQARAAARGIVTRPASIPVAVGAGVAAGAASQEQTIR